MPCLLLGMLGRVCWFVQAYVPSEGSTSSCLLLASFGSSAGSTGLFSSSFYEKLLGGSFFCQALACSVYVRRYTDLQFTLQGFRCFWLERKTRLWLDDLLRPRPTGLLPFSGCKRLLGLLLGRLRRLLFRLLSGCFVGPVARFFSLLSGLRLCHPLLCLLSRCWMGLMAGFFWFPS